MGVVWCLFFLLCSSFRLLVVLSGLGQVEAGSIPTTLRYSPHPSSPFLLTHPSSLPSLPHLSLSNTLLPQHSLKSSLHQALDFFPQFLERIVQHMRRDEIQWACNTYPFKMILSPSPPPPSLAPPPFLIDFYTSIISRLLGSMSGRYTWLSHDCHMTITRLSHDWWGIIA